MQYMAQKTETHRTRLTTGGNLINCPGEFSTPTSDLTTIEFHIKSAILDVKSIYMCMDVNYFHLNNQMDRDKYIMIQLSIIPQESVENYNLTEKSHNRDIYARLTNICMYYPKNDG